MWREDDAQIAPSIFFIDAAMLVPRPPCLKESPLATKALSGGLDQLVPMLFLPLGILA